jgi:hypothetical protein
MCSKHKLVFCTALLLFFIFPRNSLAAIVFTISNPIVNENDEIEVDASISGLISSSCSTGGCYLQAQIRVLNESKGFFGYTYNNSGEFVDYFSSVSSVDEIKTKLFNFVPVSGAWSGKLKAKNNLSNSNYIGPGQYTLKFRRFSGNSTSPTGGDSDVVTMALVAATPTPEPTATPTNTPTPTPTVTSNPTATPTKTSSPTPTKSPTPKPTPLQSPSGQAEELVLGIRESLVTPEATSETLTNEKKKFPLFAVILISAGILCIAGALFFLIKENAKKIA